MMKRLGIFLATVLLALPAPAVGKTLSVQVRNGQLRASPSFLGKPVANLSYGERVEVLQEKSPWVEVRAASGAAGWIHASSLTTKRIAMRAGSETVESGASSDEIALAGKGFNPQVEREYKARNRAIDFTWVDKMETWKVSPEEMVAFLKEGGISPPPGGAP